MVSNTAFLFSINISNKHTYGGGVVYNYFIYYYERSEFTYFFLKVYQERYYMVYLS